jgi:hypothetical protein
VVLSAAHLKYLANAFFLLAPSALPIALCTALLSPRRLIETAEAKVLTTASLSLLLYASVVRPVWGPYDWDLFSLTALLVAALAAHVTVRCLDHPALANFAVLTIGGSLLLVAIPFLVIGASSAYPAGPFAIESLATHGNETPIDALERLVGPWL